MQAWPLAWLSRISIQRLPYWTFLQTLTCWCFTRGKATAYLQFQRGLRQFSHHSTVPPFLDVRAQRMQRRLAEAPPEVVPGVYHTLTWLDNFLQYMNLTEERHQRTQDSEKHATVIGYAVPRKEAAMVPEELPSPGWNRLPAGTVLSHAPPRFLCIDSDPEWAGAICPEKVVGAHICNRPGRQLDQRGVGLQWYEALSSALTIDELAEQCPQLVSHFGRTPFTLVPLDQFATMMLQSAVLQHLSRVQHHNGAVKHSECSTPLPVYEFRFPQVPVDAAGRLGEPRYAEGYRDWPARSQLLNPTRWDGKRVRESDLRRGSRP